MAYSWDDLRCFLAVAETGSLSAAARQLEASQPTIGRRIKALEETLSAQLLKRSEGRYALTLIGQNVYEQARRMEMSAFAIQRRVAGHDAELSGRVCLASTECLGTSWLMRQLVDCRRRFPRLDFDLSTGIGLSDLLRQEADIAVRLGDPGPESLDRTLAGQAAFGLYASRDYLEHQGAPETLADLRDHAVVESLRELSSLVQVRELRRHVHDQHHAVATNSLLAQLRIVTSGLAIAALPCYLAQPEQPALVRLLADDFHVTLDLWIVMHRDLGSTPRFVQVREHLLEGARRDRAQFLGESQIDSGARENC